MNVNSNVTLSGQRSFEVSRRSVTPRGSLRHLFEIVRNALPFAGDADSDISAYRIKNMLNVWRGFWRITLAVMLRIPTYYGAVYATVIRGDGRIEEYGLVSLRVVTTAGVNYLVDALQNITEPENFKYHAFGVGTTAEAAGDTALVTEESTSYNPNSTRPTGSQTEGASANIYRSVATYTPDSGGVRAIGKAMAQTGLAAETLSALKFRIEQAGGSFGDLQGGLKDFQKLIGSAAEGSKKAAAELKELGLGGKNSLTTLDAAFKTAVKSILSLPVGIERSNLAMKAFGDDGYKLLPFFKSFNGNVDEMIRTTKELGVVLGTDAVRKAEQFHKTLEETKALIQGVTYSIGEAFLPVVKDALDQTNNYLKANQTQVKEWANTAADSVAAVITMIQKATKELSEFRAVQQLTGMFQGSTITDKGVQAPGILAGGGGLLGWWFDKERAISAYTRQRQDNAENNVVRITGDLGTYVDPALRSVIGAGGKKGGGGGSTADAMRRFFEEQGFVVSRTTGRARNPGSLHPLGRAADVSVRGKSITEITNLVAAAIEHGYRLFDERIKRPGVRQTGPHLHFEKNQNKSSDFLGQGFYTAPLDYLRSLDARRLGKGTVSTEDISKFVEQQSDALTAQARNENLAMAVDFYHKFGLIPDGKLLNDFQKMLSDDARSQGVVQPGTGDVAQMFRENAANRLGMVGGVGGSVSSALISRRGTMDEDYVKNFREGLDLSGRMTMLVLRQRNLQGEISAEVESQTLGYMESAVELEKEYEILLRRNLAEEAGLAVTSERNQVTREIQNLQMEITNAGQNDALIIQAAHLRDILDLRNRERDAVISVNRAQLELSQSMTISNNQIRAGVYEHLAGQKSMNQAISEGINKTYDSLSALVNGPLNALDQKTKGLLSFIIEPIKAFQNNSLSNIFTGVIDSLFPGVGSQIEKAKDPLVGELKDQTGLLRQIALNTGGGAGVNSNGGGLGGILGRIFGGGQGPGGTPNFNPDGTIPNNYDPSQLMNTINLRGGGTYSTGNRSILSQIFGAGGIFGDKGFGNNVGTYGALGGFANIAGGLIGGRVGGLISGAGSGLGFGAQIGSFFGPGGTAIGAAVGAVAGGIFGLFSSIFGRNSARRRDEQTRNQGMLDAQAAIRSQFDALSTQIRFGQIDPASAIIRGTAIGDQVRSQYLQMANSLQDSKTRRIAVGDVSRVDSLIAQKMAELRGLSEVAQGSADRLKRILPEFAGGHYFADYFRPNGLLPGMFDGRDDILAKISRGEMVLNPSQINNVRRKAGFDVFAGAGIPNYPRANPSSHLAQGGIAGGIGLAAAAPQVVMQPRFTLVVEGATFDEKTRAYMVSDDGNRTLVDVIKKKRKSGDI